MRTRSAFSAVARGWLLPLATLGSIPTSVGAATYVIPHVLEVQGRTSTDAYKFDHQLFMLYGAGLGGTSAGGGALVDLYLYDNSNGDPLQNFGADVCNPCSYDLGIAGPPKASVSIESLIDTGSGFDTAVKLGFAILVVGADAGNVAFESDILNSHTGPFDLSILSSTPARLRAEDPGAPGARVFLAPHLIERAGKITNTQYTFDQTYYAVYTAGLAGTPAGPGASVDLYLYDNSGAAPLKNNGVDVCNPCSYTLGGANPRKRTIQVDDLITAQGAFDASVKLGCAVVVVNGDAGNVTLCSLNSNARTSAFDLGMSAPAVVPIEVAPTLAVLLDPRLGAVQDLRVSPNPVRSDLACSFELSRETEVELSLYDLAGRKVATLFSGRLPAGRHERTWSPRAEDPGPLPGGMYFARLTGGDGSAVSRFAVLH